MNEGLDDDHRKSFVPLRWHDLEARPRHELRHLAGRPVPEETHGQAFRRSLPLELATQWTIAGDAKLDIAKPAPGVEQRSHTLLRREPPRVQGVSAALGGV